MRTATTARAKDDEARRTKAISSMSRSRAGDRLYGPDRRKRTIRKTPPQRKESVSVCRRPYGQCMRPADRRRQRASADSTRVGKVGAAHRVKAEVARMALGAQSGIAEHGAELVVAVGR